MTGANPSAILVIRLGSIGDVLLATPLLRVLRWRYPAARLRFLVKPAYADLVRLNPNVDEVVTWPAWPREPTGTLRKRELPGSPAGEPRAAPLWSRPVRELVAKLGFPRPLWVVDLQASPRSRAFARLPRPQRTFTYGKDYLRRELLVRRKINRYPAHPTLIAERYFAAVEPLGLKPDGRGLDLVAGDEAEQEAADLLGSGLSRVAVAPGARWATKRWPPESFASAARRVARERGAGLVVLGGADDALHAAVLAKLLGGDTCAASNAGGARLGLAEVPVLNLAGRLTLLQSAAVLRRCELLLSNDSGLLHVAAALRVPAVALFGSTVPELGFAPYRSPARVLGVYDLPCRPCTHVGRAACPLGHFKCMRRIAPQEVVGAARELLESGEREAPAPEARAAGRGGAAPSAAG